MGCKTLPRNLFPTLLHQAMNKISGSSVSASFVDTGIFPLNANAVEALVPNRDNTLPTDASNTSVNSDVEVCQSCGNSTENPLVKHGLVDRQLASSLIPPPLPPKKSKSSGKRKSHELAEAVYSSEVTLPVPGTSKQTRRESHCRILQDDNTNAETSSNSGVLCEVCMTNADMFWVGCDTCDRWYHYNCLSAAA